MDELSRFRDRTGLLISVRSAAEAEVALAGGADVIDVKEPNRGSLGAADADVIAAVVAAIAGRASISVAAGELLDWPATPPRPFMNVIAGGVKFVKFGLAGCANEATWQSRWEQAFELLGDSVKPVAVVYADWQASRAPTPDEVLAHAKCFHCPALLVDTWSKSVGDVFDRWPIESLATFAARVRAAGIHLVLAGSLRLAAVTTAIRCRPSLLAVRGAVCDGDRRGAITASRVAAFRAALDATQLHVGTEVDDSHSHAITQSNRHSVTNV
jgi:(5-formylfuran-3-yl)methyl phosphate synthase